MVVGHRQLVHGRRISEVGSLLKMLKGLHRTATETAITVHAGKRVMRLWMVEPYGRPEVAQAFL